MAITYTVGATKVIPVTITGADDNTMKSELSVEYEVIVSDPADSDFKYSDVDETDVAASGELPRVNRTTFKSASGLQYPFMVCRSLSIKRDQHELTMFHATAKYRSLVVGTLNSGDFSSGEPPAALTDLTPQVTPIFGEIQRVIYEDKSDPAVPILTPTGNYYSTPAMERIPTLTLEISQYETEITFAECLERKFKTNEEEFRGDDPGTWMIISVEPLEVEVELSGGATTAALVTYQIAKSPFDAGWADERALIDTHYLDDDDKKLPFTDEAGGQTFGFVQADGTKKTSGATPDYTEFVVQGEIDYDDFLHSSVT